MVVLQPRLSVIAQTQICWQISAFNFGPNYESRLGLQAAGSAAAATVGCLPAQLSAAAPTATDCQLSMSGSVLSRQKAKSANGVDFVVRQPLLNVVGAFACGV
jgi:hypothetical protein